MDCRMLIINMGSTSTKVAVYNDNNELWTESLSHPREEIESYSEYIDQYGYRKRIIVDLLEEKEEDLKKINAFISRGGTIKPVSGGTFIINETMLKDAWSGLYGEHPCNIGLQIAFDLGKEYDIPAFTVDPPVCNEMCIEATYSGIPEIKRISSFQALNQRAIARKYCVESSFNYKDVNLIVAHMGGGISVAAHKRSKIVDVNNALAGDGPFSLERSGDLPVGDLINLCYSNKYTHKEMLRKVNGKGGMVSYLNNTDARKMEEEIIGGNAYVLEVTNAMAYQVSKEIASIAAVLKGEVNAILLTGGLAYWDRFVELIIERVAFIAPVHRYPGENEMEALASGVYRYLDGQEEIKRYI